MEYKADKTFTERLKENLNGGVLLMVMALLAMIIANSPWNSYYTEVWNHPVVLRIGDFNLFSHHGEPLTLMEFINDALMAIFFFMVGLEIKREVLAGELSSLRKAMFPIIAAIGGMILPVLIYFMVCSSGAEASGLAIPMATDIAFSLGVLSLLGKRVPVSLKVFLTAFAVVDDIGGILVIAIFYTGHISWGYIIASAVVVALLFIGNKINIFNKTFYIALGIVLWYFFLQSGIHCTIAGVLLAFLIPARPQISMKQYLHHISKKSHKMEATEEDILNEKQLHQLEKISSATDSVVSPMQSLEHSMHGFVNYFIMPLFAFANAGVVISGGSGTMGNVTLAIVLGLLVGKFLGVFLFSLFAVKMRWVVMPEGMNVKNLVGIAFLGGIGFTVSLFISNLSFADAHQDLLNQAKIGVLLGTVVAGLIGYIYLNMVLPKAPKS